MNNEEIIRNLGNIKKELGNKISLADEEVLRVDEAREFISRIREEIRNLLPKDSIPYRKYESLLAKWNGWWVEEKETGRYISKSGRNYQHLIYWRDVVIGEILKKYKPEFLASSILNRDQFHFSKDDSFKGKEVVLDIMKEAKDSIVIIDPYLDEVIFKYTNSINKQIKITLITSKIQDLFLDLLNDLRKSGKKINARRSNQYHDRYIVLDDKEIWHLGASINGIGKKEFDISKVRDKEAINNFFKNYKQNYINSKEVTYFTEKREVKKEVAENIIIKNFKDIIYIVKSKWGIEKKSDPVNIYNSQEILNILFRQISEISFMIQPLLNKEKLNLFDSNIIKLRKHLDYEVVMNGGKSYKNYWKIGDEIVGDFIEIIHEL